MNILGPEGVVYGVEDMGAAKRFWTDFGLTLVDQAPDRLDFACADGGEIVVRPKDVPGLPKPVVEGSTGREFVWGVEAERDLAEIADALHGVDGLEVGNDSVRVTDPNGYALRFRVSRRAEVDLPPTAYNDALSANRIDVPAELHDKATPVSIEHLVFFAPRFEACYEFFVDRLQFRMSDTYPGESWFFRARGGKAHHNLFFIHHGERAGFDHVAFVVRNIHELMGGGLNMTEQGWKTKVGPGRHPISGSYFWYFHNPCGGAAEYDWDTTVCTDEWAPRDWPADHRTFAEWMVPDGLARFKGFERREDIGDEG